jgi:hypothetical protein
VQPGAFDTARILLAMGVEVHFPEVFAEHDRLDVDGCPSPPRPARPPSGRQSLPPSFTTEAQAHAVTNSLWASFAIDADTSVAAPSPDLGQA